MEHDGMTFIQFIIAVPVMFFSVGLMFGMMDLGSAWCEYIKRKLDKEG